ncbi:MAG: thioredoxin domain-containing protein [Polyangiaceae bacterium]
MSQRFSPRPNRAADIGWMEWGPEAFARAKETDRPILLGISAVWCHWCHVMDETTYSDSRVIELIRDQYVPIRVDNDRRPDVNARYNMGGWPTTVFLSPDGDILTGATYVPPDDFAQLLERVSSVWKEDRTNIERRLLERRQTRGASASAEGVLDEEAPANIAAAIVANYDETYGGFGSEPKFPQAEVLQFLLLLYRRDRAEGKADERLYSILARTALGMARGGMYDHIEGGFFRYSTTRDWSIPHFEKMAEDHAGLIKFYADLYRMSGNEQFAQTLRSSVRWLRSVLRNPNSPLFGGSQDADEEYFALPLDERRAREAPFVDRTVYTNWNAALCSALVAASTALDDETLLNDAQAALKALLREMRVADGLALHCMIPGEAPQEGPLLTDQVALLSALLDLHAATGVGTFIDEARRLADATISFFRREDGAFVDSADEQAFGNLRIPYRPLDENAEMADVLLRLGAILGDDRCTQTANQVLAALSQAWRGVGAFAAPYGSALVRALSEPLVITIVGTSGESSELRDAALRLVDPLAVVYTLAPNDRFIQERGYLVSEVPLAYACAGKRCAAPASDAAALQEALESLRQLPVR